MATDGVRQLQTRQVAVNGAGGTRSLARTTRREGLPFDLHMSPGGGGQSPYGLTFSGTF